MTQKEQLAWAAGFFDGEGYVGVTQARGKKATYRVIILSIRQVDREVLDRFHKIFKVGTVGGPYRHGRTSPTHKPVFSYQTRSLESVQHIMCHLWPWLSKVKRNQFKAAVNEIVAYHNLPRGQKGVAF